jgi:hypothetical protein
MSASQSCSTDTTADLSDTANGTAVYSITYNCLLYTQEDVARVKWEDDRARDNIQDNENIIKVSSTKTYADGKVESVSITDMDGDGVVNGEEQYAGKARVELTCAEANGVTESAVIEVAAGPDRNFDTEGDNQILTLNWKRTKDGEVLASAVYTDADGDGMLVDNASTDASVVDLSLYEQDNIFKPFVESTSLDIRMEVTDEEGDGRVISISGEEILINGRINRIKAVNADGEEVINPRDMVHVYLTTDYPVDTDSMLNAEVIFVLNVGDGLQDVTDNLLYELHATSEPRWGLVKKWEFHFIADDPVPHGEKAKNGSVEIIAIYKDGKTASLAGTFDVGKLDATLTGPEGNSLTVKWDTNGTIIEEG